MNAPLWVVIPVITLVAVAARTRKRLLASASMQQVLGHASITTTQRYAKLSDEAVMREAARLGAT